MAGIDVRRTTVTVVGMGLVAALLAGCPPGDPPATPSPTTTASVEPTITPTPEPTAEGGDLTVWAMTDTGTEVRLVREQRTVAEVSVQAAVEEMIAGPTDPDYFSAWDPGTTVLGVDTSLEAVSVDLTADARTANIGSAGAGLMMQQLIYTVTDALADPGREVVLLIEGEPAGELWGAVIWDGPMGREDPISARLLVQIDAPREGATSSSPLAISGEAAVFEATLPWRVLDEAGTEVASGVATTAEGQTFAPYSFTVDLPPGTYTVVVTEDDPSGGEGRAPMQDSRTVTIG